MPSAWCSIVITVASPDQAWKIPMTLISNVFKGKKFLKFILTDAQVRNYYNYKSIEPFFSPFAQKTPICYMLWPISLLCLVNSVMFHYSVDMAEHYWCNWTCQIKNMVQQPGKLYNFFFFHAKKGRDLIKLRKHSVKIIFKTLNL